MCSKVPVAFLLLGVAVVFSAPPPPYHATKAPVQYEYQYAVSDEYAGLDYGQTESRNGYETTGSYHVLLPDGRVQRVQYSVVGDQGYDADVTYEGEAKEYQPAPKYEKPAPSYHHAPEYHPRPSYHAAPVYHQAPVYGARHYGGARARTYNLQKATEAPLAEAEEAAAEEPAAVEEAEEVAEEVEEEAAKAEEAEPEAEAAAEGGEEAYVQDAE
ncbi:cuticle protein 7-like [Pollicipes pollicipes]|uniref:cuticle protein 7-like n=1 Tax=Pollicipes pollicipes TaxID=41117 RepID=UPI00188556EB|nr:cuticle protein 7-like [Pollicipes pollicipes]